MGVKAADPGALSLDTAFAEAMGAPPKPKEPAAPPEIDPAAPYGRDDAGEPLAPYGRKPDGTVKRSAGGRPPKDADAKARTSKHPAKDTAKSGKVTGPAVQLEARDFTEAIAGLGDAVWLGLTMAGRLPLARIPFAPADADVKLQAQATVFRAHKPMLASGLNLAAQHSAMARRFCEKLDAGDMTWALTVGVMMAPFALQSIAMWKGQMDPAVVAQLADRNETDLADFGEQVKAMIAAQMEAAGAPEPEGQAPGGA